MAQESTIRLNPNLREFWKKKAKIRVLTGGRSSSKTMECATMAIFLALNVKFRMLCVRNFQNKIKDSVYTVLKERISTGCYSDCFEITNNSITCTITGAEFIFYGLARNIEEIKGIEADCCWVEEGEALTEAQWMILWPTIIRHPGYFFWIVFNPRLITDFAWKNFVVKPPTGCVHKHINYMDNPFLDKDAIHAIESYKETDLEGYKHYYLGEPLTDDENSVIQRSWVMAAIGAHEKLGITVRGSHRIGFDVGDTGDPCATITAHGNKAIGLDTWKGKEDELLKSCMRVYASAREYNASITYDAIGVGAFAGSKFNDLNLQNNTRIRHNKYFAGGTPTMPDATYGVTGIKNRDFFSNVKAQSWWDVADRLKNTYNAINNGYKFRDDEMIFISPDLPNLPQLIDELTTPNRDFDPAGRVKVESKKDLAKRGISSPNLGDSFILAFSNTSTGGLF